MYRAECVQFTLPKATMRPYNVVMGQEVFIDFKIYE